MSGRTRRLFFSENSKESVSASFQQGELAHSRGGRAQLSSRRELAHCRARDCEHPFWRAHTLLSAHFSMCAISSARIFERVDTRARARVPAKWSTWSARCGAPRVGSRHQILYYIMQDKCYYALLFCLLSWQGGCHSMRQSQDRVQSNISSKTRATERYCQGTSILFNV